MVMVSGEVAATAYAYMRATWGLDVWTRMLAHLTPEERGVVDHVADAPSLPVTVDGHVYEALVTEAFAGDRAVAERELRRAGRAQAEPSLRRTLGPFALFLTPAQAFGRAGEIVTGIYEGATSRTEVDPGGSGGVVRVSGLGQACYAAPWQCGWMEGALSYFGAQRVRVTERAWDAGAIASDELVFDVRWA